MTKHRTEQPIQHLDEVSLVRFPHIQFSRSPRQSEPAQARGTIRNKRQEA